MLSGEIPESLYKLTGLSYLFLSYSGLLLMTHSLGSINWTAPFLQVLVAYMIYKPCMLFQTLLCNALQGNGKQLITRNNTRFVLQPFEVGECVALGQPTRRYSEFCCSWVTTVENFVSYNYVRNYRRSKHSLKNDTYRRLVIYMIIISRESCLNFSTLSTLTFPMLIPLRHGYQEIPSLVPFLPMLHNSTEQIAVSYFFFGTPDEA